jgi:hypothetical protein
MDATIAPEVVSSGLRTEIEAARTGWHSVLVLLT